MLQLYVLSFSFLLIASSDFITLFMQVIADLASHSRENAFFTPDYENWYIVPTTKAWQIALVQFFLLRVYLVTILLLEGAFQFWSFGGQSVKRLIIGGWKVFFFPKIIIVGSSFILWQELDQAFACCCCRMALESFWPFHANLEILGDYLWLLKIGSKLAFLNLSRGRKHCTHHLSCC